MGVIIKYDIDYLISLIYELNKDVSIEYSEYLSKDIPIVKQIENLADKLLITDQGQCNNDNISILELHNFNVYPLESDSFGWLIGGIFTYKGIVTYG
jgi:hypothetical protein